MRLLILTLLFTIVTAIAVQVTAQACMGITGYAAVTANCPPNQKVPGTPVAYMDGIAVHLPATGSSIDATGSTPIPGKLGNVFDGQSTVTFGASDFTTTSFSMSFYVSKTTPLAASGTLTLVQFNTVGGGTFNITMETDATASALTFEAKYSDGASVDATVTGANTATFLNVNNLITITRITDRLILDLNGAQLASVTTGQFDYLSHTDVLISTVEADSYVDEFAIFDPALTSTQRQLLPKMYEENCGWPTNHFGAPKPYIDVSYAASTVTTVVTLLKKPNTYYRLNTTSFEQDQCLNGTDAIGVSAGIAWNENNDDVCIRQYTLPQTLASVYTSTDNNNWVIGSTDSGKTITHNLQLYMTYSNIFDFEGTSECSVTSYSVGIQFNNILVPVSTTEFTSADKTASMVINRIYIDGTDVKIVARIISTLNDVDFDAITMSKGANNFTSSANDCIAPTGGKASCTITFSIAFTTLNTDGQIAGSDYKVTFDMIENGVPTKSGEVIEFGLEYNVPQQPGVITGESIESSITLLEADSDGAAPVPTTISYKPTSTMFLVNEISTGDIPSDFRLRLKQGYICCVEYTKGNTITAYDPDTNTGGCADDTGKSAHHDLGNSTDIGVGVGYTPASAGSYKRYRLSIALTDALAGIPASPQTCQILLVSEFEGPGATRSIVSTYAVDSSKLKSMEVSSLNNFDLSSEEDPAPAAPVSKNQNKVIAAVAGSAGAVVGLLLIVVIMLAIGIAVFAFMKRPAKGAAVAPTTVELVTV